jgi:hypothetical protein
MRTEPTHHARSTRRNTSALRPQGNPLTQYRPSLMRSTTPDAMTSSTTGSLHALTHPRDRPLRWRADAASRQISRPDGVATRFHVSVNKVEPVPAVLTRNLFSKDDWRAALLDEPEPRWPKMARIVGTLAAARHAPRLAGTGACPDSTIVGPSSETQGIAPSSDAGEEMALREPSQISGLNIRN